MTTFCLTLDNKTNSHHTQNLLPPMATYHPLYRRTPSLFQVQILTYETCFGEITKSPKPFTYYDKKWPISSVHEMQKIEAKGEKIKSNPLSSNYWIKKTTGIIPGQQYHLHLQHIPVSIMKFCKKTFTVLVYLYPMVYGIYRQQANWNNLNILCIKATFFTMFHIFRKKEVLIVWNEHQYISCVYT